MTEFILSAFADEAGTQLEEQIAALKEAHISRIELRGVNGKNIKDLTTQEAEAAAHRLAQAGITLSALGSPYGKFGIDEDFEPHLREFSRGLELAQIFGTKKIRMFSFFIPKGIDPASKRSEVLARLDKMLNQAETAGIALAHENEKGIYGDTAARCRDLLDAFGGALKCVFDPANFIQCGEDPLENYETLKDVIDYMHIKDADKANGAVVPCGEGDGNVAEILRRLAGRTKQMGLTLEPHLAVFDGLGKLQDEKVQHRFSYPDSRTAFTAAADALKHVLTKLGFADEGGCGTWTK